MNEISTNSPAPAIERIMGLAPLQSGILFHAISEPDSPAYFEQIICRLDGTVHPDRFRAALAALVARHEALRSGFVTRGQTEPRQVVFRHCEVPLLVEDWVGRPAVEQAEAITALLASQRQEGFRLNRAPLMRLALVREEQSVWKLIWSHHHILMDGWSLSILLEDFFSLLSAPDRALPPSPGFADYVAWIQAQDRSRDAAFWRTQIQDAAVPTPLGIDRVGRRDGATRDMRTLRAVYPAAAVSALAAAAGVTVGSVLAGAYAILLGRLGRTDDVVLGMVLSGRAAPVQGIERMIGLLANSLPLRVSLPPEAELVTWLADVQRRQHALQPLSHCALPDISHWAGIPADRPLFESLVAIDNFPLADALSESAAGFLISEASQYEHTSLPLTLTFVPGPEQIAVKLGFDAARIEPSAAQALLDTLGHVLQEMASRPNKAIGGIGLRPAVPKFIPPTLPRLRGAERGLAGVFLETAVARGDAVAVTDPNGNVSYAALARQARAIAGRLVAAGIQPGDRIALLLERDATQIAGMLGVLIAGGCYVPLDPGYPTERLAFIVSDSAARHVLAVSATEAQVPAGASIILLDDGADPVSELPEPAATPDWQPAYVIYTSGSTGQPKGVPIAHGNVRRLFEATRAGFGITAEDVWSCTHSFSFDFSIWEIWGALLLGGRVVVVPRETARDPQALLTLLAGQRVTMLSQTPSSFRLLAAARAEADRTLSLRHVVFGGEALHARDLAGWISRHGDCEPCLTNMYGITEITVHATVRRIRAADVGADVSLIGRPLRDLTIRLVDRHGHDVPDGAIGEILVGGAGVAAGYLNRETLTRERFANRDGVRFYHSGDLARRAPDGELLFIGRADDQIKVRGHRIEPNEVRAALLEVDTVADAFVAAEQHDDPRLLAWYVSKSGSHTDPEQLRAYLQRRLPTHEIPSLLIPTEQFVQTANGKLDRSALPRPVQGDRIALVAPITAEQRALAEIWQDVLGLDAVGIEDDYFALGGDSIRSIRLVGLARERNLAIGITDLFRLRTIKAILSAPARRADERPAGPTPAFAMLTPEQYRLLPEGIEDAYPLARLQAGMLFHTESEDGRRLYHDVFCFRVRAPIALDRLKPALHDLVAAHPVLRSSFLLDGVEGPLQLVHAWAEPEVRIEDLTGLDARERAVQVESLLDRLREVRHDPSHPALLRLTVQVIGEGHWQLGFAFHHAILDGWSVATLLTELVARLTGNQPAAPATRYRDFVLLERAALADEQHRSFWRRTLADAPFTAMQPWNGQGRLESYSRVGKQERALTAGIVTGLDTQAKRLSMPLKSLLLALHARVMAVASGQQEVVTGLVCNGRPSTTDGGAVLGLFLNTVPFRLSTGDSSLADLARLAAETEAQLLPYRRYPMAEMLSLAGRKTLFETSFNFVNFHAYDAVLDDLEVLEARSVEAFEIPLAATFSVTRSSASESGLTLGLSYDRAIFPDMQIDWLLVCYERAAALLATAPDAHCADADLAGSAEMRRVADLSTGRKTASPAPDLLDRFRSIVRHAPQRTAVRAGDGSLDFAMLDVQSDRLAGRLIQYGVGCDSIVAVALEAGDRHVPTALLAIMKAGGANLMLDLSLPAARLRHMLEDASPHVVLVSAATEAKAGALGDSNRLRIDQSLNGPAVATDHRDMPDTARAYIVFTSGSTGRPKPVEISRGALANHMAWMARAYPLEASDVVLQKTPVGFDASVWEFWAPLTEGATLALAPADAARLPDLLCDSVVRYGVTILQVVPSLLDVILEDDAALARLGSLRRLFVGGEALRAAVVARCGERLGAQLVNLYGPAEATIDATSAELDPGVVAVPLGEPVDNAALHLLDDALQPVPFGVAGELWIGGAPLARCYLGLPGETASRFRPDHLSGAPGSRLYRTGDLARRLPDGTLAYIGRRDQQVKLRGWRLELGEIENLMTTHPAVRRCCVVATDEGNGATRLTAFVEPQPGRSGAGADASSDYRAFLQQSLPAALLPGKFIALDDWPLLPSGKTDRNALPDPRQQPTAAPAAKRSPETERERILAAIWKDLLPGDGNLGIDEDFFALGGDSVIGLQITARARQAGLTIAPRDVFEHSTIAGLARVAAEHRPAATEVAPPGLVPLTPAQAWFFSQSQPLPAHWNQAFLLRLPGTLGTGAVKAALERVLEVHEAFRLRFRIAVPAQGEPSVEQELVEALPSPTTWFSHADLRGSDETQAIAMSAQSAQAGLDLSTAPLFRAVYMTGLADGSGRLLLVAHHLIIDGVSWRNLMGELTDGLSNSGTGREATLPELGFAGWARHLARQETGANDAYWRETAQCAARAGRLRDTGALPACYGDMRSIETTLDAKATATLLQDGAARLRASAAEIILSGVLAAVARWKDDDAIGVTMEHHGRSGTHEPSLARSVGWFTTLYPLVVEIGSTPDPLERLRRVKAALRAVPDDGRDYGRCDLGDIPLPELCFNYLGQTGGTLAAGSGIAVADEPIGEMQAPENKRPHVLEVVALVVEGRLLLRWVHDPACHGTATVTAMAERAVAEMQAAISASRPDGAADTSDFPLLRGEQDDLADLLRAEIPVEDLRGLTPVQDGMLFHSRLADNADGIYVEQVIAALEGECDTAVLAEAWSLAYSRHDALRTSFTRQQAGHGVQRTHLATPLEVETRHLPPNVAPDTALAAFLMEDRARGFDLERPPLMRLTLLRRSDGTAWRLVWTHHHALLDGWSMSILFGEVAQSYAALRAGAQPTAAPAVAFSRFLADLSRRRDAGQGVEEAFWRSYLSDAGTPLDLGLLAGNSGTPQTSTTRCPLGRALSGSVAALAARERVTPNTVLLAAYAMLLSRLSRQRDVILGVTFSGRGGEAADQFEGVVGLLISTLPVRVRISPAMAVGPFLRAVFASQNQAGDFEHSSLVDIQRWSGAALAVPLFETVFVYENYPVDRLAGRTGEGLQIGAIETEERSNYPLTLYVKPDQDGLILDAVHDNRRLPAPRMELLLEALVTILEGLSRAPAAVGEIGLSPASIRPPYAPMDARRAETLLTMLDRRAIAPACAVEALVVGPDRSLSHDALLDASRALARRLHSIRVGPGDTVAVCLPRGTNLLLALLGTLLSGASYLPLDPALPEARVAAMVEDAAPAAVIAEAGRVLPGAAGRPHLPVVGPEPVPLVLPAPHPASLAYTIFTSGSTGRPKGVEIGHAALANLLQSFVSRSGIGPADVLLSVTTISFDIAALELFLPLLTGSGLVIASAETAASGVALASEIARHRVTVMQATPATWRLLMAADWEPPPGFRAWCGGEPLPRDLAESLLARGVTLLNLYGPTETTIWSAALTVHDVARAGDIGGALDATGLHVVDSDLHAVPPGIPGELMISGAGLARGYLRDPGRTARNFRPDPFSAEPGGRLYATGDLATRQPDGTISLLGRIDQQVKINGLRIELGEIEHALRALPGVGDAAASLRLEAAGRPVGIDAHLVLHGNAAFAGDEGARAALSQMLPAAWMPQSFTLHETLPRTANGKLDRKALQSRQPATLTMASRRDAAGAVEQAVLAVWQDVLAGRAVGVDDDFFALGGDSLLLTQIHTRLVKVFRSEPPLGDMLASRTPAGMAVLVGRHEAKPGQADKLAGAYLRLRAMSPEERDALRAARQARLSSQAGNGETRHAN